MASRGNQFNAKWNKFSSAFGEALLDAGKKFTKQGETMVVNGMEAFLNELHNDFMSNQTPRDRFITDKRSGRVVHGNAHGSHNFPWFTGTLHDSISGRIAEGSRTVGVRYMQGGPASDAQFADPDISNVERYYPRIVGSTFGRLLAGRATRVSQRPIVAQLFIGAPYAQEVNEMPEHDGYIEDMQVRFISAIEDVFAEQRIKNLIIR